ncbi:MAG: hypothetical protein KC483_09050 [Nitrosarchaeum sp.]|nr:hypothetical protein [Nitrosarchaeum sp.]MCA9820669.1 hypothetical protein [Nitrosarchaeum sp.]
MKLESPILKDELERLEHLTGIKTNCKIVWTPITESEKEGKVVDDTIYIYSCNLTDAIHTLQHEFFDILVSRTNKRYVEIINMLLSIISEKIYKEKEEIVESLVRLARHSFDYTFSAKNDPAVA